MRLLTTLCFISLLFFTGCASIISGNYQDVRVTSRPMGVHVYTDRGQGGRTPCTLKLKRNKEVTVFADYDGETQQTTLTHGLQGWFWGNIVFGGIIGGAIDLGTGACDKLSDDHLHFDFQYVDQYRSQRRADYLATNPDIDAETLYCIEAGNVKEGMTREQIIAALGEPARVTENVNGIFMVYYENNKKVIYPLTPEGIYKKKKVTIYRKP